MSLEQALAANTAAVEKLTTILQAANDGETPAKKPRKTAGAATEQAGSAAAPQSAQTTSPVPAVAQQTPAPTVGLKDVADFFMALAGKDRATAVAIIAKYGVAKLSEVPAANLGDVLTACHAEAGKLGGGLVRNAAGVVEFTPAQSAASSLI